jgi:hypothetical protein
MTAVLFQSCTLFKEMPSSSNALISATPTEPQLTDPQPIAACPAQFQEWSLVKQFETAHYFLALCQQGDSTYLVGQEKKNRQAFITALARLDGETIIADDGKRFSYEIRQGTLTVKKAGTIIVQEGVQEGRQQEINSAVQ